MKKTSKKVKKTKVKKRSPQTYIAEYTCGCTDEARLKSDLLDYCAKHGGDLRRIHPPVTKALM